MLPITARARLLSLALQKFPPGKGKKKNPKKEKPILQQQTLDVIGNENSTEKTAITTS